MGRECRCGKEKSADGEFCDSCWDSLPVSVQREFLRVWFNGDRIAADHVKDKAHHILFPLG